MFLHAGLLVERKGLTSTYFLKFLQQNSIFHAVVCLHIAGQDTFEVECRESEVLSFIVLLQYITKQSSSH
jgi:hypothetical protein